MYNFPSSPFGRPPGFGQGFPPSQGPPPGMGAPSGMSAPGTAAPPGMPQQNNQQQSRSGFPPNFQPPANMPNINFAAPVIRLGTSGPAKPGTPGGEPGRQGDYQRPGRGGLGASGMEGQRQGRESMLPLVPPTKEEMVRTIFVGGITEGAGGDEGMEKILQSAGNLKRWLRAMDAENKPCRFGFAEYEDPESLATAIDVLKNVEVPVKPQSLEKKDEDTHKVEKSSLLIVVDDGTLDYLDNYRQSKEDQDPIQAQLRLNAARSSLAAVLSELENPSAPVQQIDMSKVDVEGDTAMQNGERNGDAEVVTIPLTMDDELSEIPAEMRETVAREIAAFRERSTRRDLERLKREEEIEAQERLRNGARPNRLASPTPTAPNGPGGANAIPVGPRERIIPGAPSGPKGFQGSQMPRDYQKSVSFVNGTGLNGDHVYREDDDTDVSDEELERRRKQKKEAEQEKIYLDQERRWLNRERSRTAAVEREKNRDQDEEGKTESAKEAAAKRYRDWNDDIEAKRGSEEYYADRSLWIRNRAAYRTREAHLDDLDRASEERERAKEVQQQNQARGMADSFLNQQALELESRAAAPREPQRFKLSLGAAAQRAQQAAATSKRTVAEVEGLLEDEEETDTTSKRTLVPIKFDSSAEASALTEEERQQAARQLAAEIPADKDGLWAWDVKWEFVDESVLVDQLRPFVEKKIVEYLGVQEQMLVEVVEEHIRSRGKPQDLVEQLEGALDDEAEVLVKKLWRMIIFFSESEKRGIQG